MFEAVHKTNQRPNTGKSAKASFPLGELKNAKDECQRWSLVLHLVVVLMWAGASADLSSGVFSFVQKLLKRCCATTSFLVSEEFVVLLE